MLWIVGAIAAGGVVEPLLLMVGLTAAGMPASGASLLLNAEGVILPHCWRGSFSRKPLTAAHYFSTSCRTPDFDQQGRKIALKVAVICQAGFQVVIDCQLNIPELHHQAFGEAGQSLKPTHSRIFGCLKASQAQQRHAKLGGEDCRQGSVFMCVDVDRANIRRLSLHEHLIQQKGFTYATQANHDDALCWTAKASALNGDPDALAQFVAA
jgi:hypothetical protein